MDPFEKNLLKIIRSGRPLSDAAFGRLALETYRRQRAANPVYRRFCEASGTGAVKRWQDIPALPVAAFKFHRIACFPAAQTAGTFVTSGTTRAGVKGKHPFRTFAFYDAAIRTLFGRSVLSDRKRGSRIPIVFLTASGKSKPQSSLSHMGDQVQRAFGQGKPFHALTAKGLDAKGLTRHLSTRADRGEAVLIYSTTFALADYLDFLASNRIRLALPEGSRIMETGGYKGRRVEVARADLVRSAGKFFGIPAHRIINEYGMTELSSQFYDLSLIRKRPLPIKGLAPWTRILIMDPMTGRPVKKGRRGLIRILDLANQGSCAAIQTEDMGRMTLHGLEILGRLPQAEFRGCSLAYESFFTRQS